MPSHASRPPCSMPTDPPLMPFSTCAHWPPTSPAAPLWVRSAHYRLVRARGRSDTNIGGGGVRAAEFFPAPNLLLPEPLRTCSLFLFHPLYIQANWSPDLCSPKTKESTFHPKIDYRRLPNIWNKQLSLPASQHKGVFKLLPFPSFLLFFTSRTLLFPYIP